MPQEGGKPLAGQGSAKPEALDNIILPVGLQGVLAGIFNSVGNQHKDGPWRDLDDVERATLTWVDWLDNSRLLRLIGDIPPAEYDMLYDYDKQTESSEVA